MTNWRNLSSLFSLLIVAAFLMTSCKKENLNLSENGTQGNNTVSNLVNGNGNENGGENGDEGDFSDCFTINYPIEVQNEDGTTTAINNDDELEAAFDAAGYDEDIELVYPIDVTITEDGSTATMESDDDVDDLFEACFGEWDDDDEDGEHPCDDDFDMDFTECFTPVFPIDVIVDGNTTTINDIDELEAFWEGLDYDSEPEIVYPIDIVLTENDSTVTINDDDELEAAIEDCYGDWDDYDEDDYDECFTLNYPVDVVLEDGSTQTVNNDDELEAAFEGTGDDFVYPIDVTMTADGATQTVNEEEDWDAVFESCDG